ncbi:MAG: serine hydrolase [Ruminococcaceae bacterium]|nr:serine hydrolase [Oscillospiraceae bacterium]
MKIKISELAKLMGISVRTLQYYDRIGLLKPAETKENGYRVYDENSVKQLEEILRYKSLSFSLKDIAELMCEENFKLKSELVRQRKKLLEKKKELEKKILALENELSQPVKIGKLNGGGLFDKILEDYNYSGFAYGLTDIEDNKNEIFFPWGKADYEKNTGFTPSSKFCIRALTTQFTAFCILLFHDLGLLDVYQYINIYLPEYINGNKIKIIHLLNMTSGISADGLPISVKPQNEFIDKVNSFPLKAKAGEIFEYSDTDYQLLGIILERICEKSLGDIFSEYIFKPLEMKSTFFGGNDADIFGFAEETKITGSNPASGASGIISTAEDMGKWYEAILNKRILSIESYDILFGNNKSEFSCGFYSIGNHRFYHSYRLYEIFFEITVDMEKGEFFLSLHNKKPIPDNNARVMFFPIRQCDDGKVKFEVWEMDPGSHVKVFSLKIYDEDSKEIYSADTDKNGYIINVFNNGEKRHAEEFCESGYFYEVDLSKICESCDREKSYFAEIKAEKQKTNSAQLGYVYMQGGEWVCGYFNVFYYYESAYELFMEALNNVLK